VLHVLGEPYGIVEESATEAAPPKAEITTVSTPVIEVPVIEDPVVVVVGDRHGGGARC